MKKKPFSSVASLMVAILISAVTQLQALDHYVTVDDFGFSPSELTIDVGDTVIWVNGDELFPHSTTSDSSYWRYVFVDQGEEFPYTFNSVGVFTYYDEVDSIHKGKITVTASSPTLITLQSPRIEAGKFLFDATGLTAGRTNVLQASTNLTSWTAISTNVAASTSMTFTNVTSFSHRFFKVFELP